MVVSLNVISDKISLTKFLNNINNLKNLKFVNLVKPHIQFALYLFGSVILLSLFAYKESGCIPILNKDKRLCNNKRKAYRGDVFDQLDLADKYYKKGQYKEAFKWYKKVLQHGYVSAYYKIGDKFLSLENKEQVFKKNTINQLINWHEKSADKGDTVAQKFLVNMYCAEIFLKNKLSEKWYREWKKKDWTTINCLLKEKNFSTPNNKKDRLDLYKKLALQGYQQAQYELANLLFQEEEKKIEAMKWLKKADLRGHPEAQYELALKLIDNNKIEEGIRQFNKSSLQWNSVDTHLKFAYAILFSESYSHSDKKHQLDKEIIKFHKQAIAIFDNPLVEYSLGIHYSNISNDINIALKWYKKSSERGFGNAMQDLGIIYTKKENHNPKEAIKWFKKLVYLHSSFKCRICHESILVIKYMGFSTFIKNFKIIIYDEH